MSLKSQCRGWRASSVRDIIAPTLHEDINSITQPHRTEAFGATVAGSQPRAFGLPRLLVDSAPLFAYCNKSKTEV